MKNSIKGHAYRQAGFAPILILIAIAAVLVVGGAGYWLYQNQVRQSAVQQQVNQQSTSTINTSNWKTFKNASGMISFVYPSSWTVKDESYVHNGREYPLFSVTSPDRFDLPGYQNVGVHYLIQISVDSANKIETVDGFAKVRVATDQSAWNTNLTTQDEKSTGEYQIAQQIIQSIKYTAVILPTQVINLSISYVSSNQTMSLYSAGQIDSGGIVYVLGENLNNSPIINVTIGGKLGTDISVLNSNQIRFRAPQLPMGTYDMYVSSPNGQKSNTLRVAVNQATSNSQTAGWKIYVFGGAQISYPADLKVAKVFGGWIDKAPFFTFPSTYLGSNLTEATISFRASVNKGGAGFGNENNTIYGQSAQPVTINGTNWYKTDQSQNFTRTVIISDGTDASAGIDSFELSMTASNTSGLNDTAAQSIISIFEKIVGTYGKNQQPFIDSFLPIKDQVVATGKQMSITWDTQNISNSASIQINLLDSQGNLVKTIVGSAPNTGSYSWLVDSSIPAGSYELSLALIDQNTGYASNKSFSDVFRIIKSGVTNGAPIIKVLSPTGGQTFSSNSQLPLNIDIENFGVQGYVSLYLTTNNIPMHWGSGKYYTLASYVKVDNANTNPYQLSTTQLGTYGLNSIAPGQYYVLAEWRGIDDSAQDGFSNSTITITQ